MSAPPLLLVLRPLGLGDFLTGVPAYRALARAFPHHRRVLAAPRALADLVPLLGATFAALVPTEPLEPLGPELCDADIAVDLHGRGPASQRILLASTPRRLISFANEAVPETRECAIWNAGEHEVDRWCRMLEHAGVATDPHDLDLDVPKTGPPAHLRGATVVHVGAAAASRRWPVDRFIDVVRSERRAGRSVVLTGGSADRERAAAVAHGANVEPRFDFSGRTTLRELATIVCNAGRVVSTDTGVAHLATAYRIPSVILFGPTSPRMWGPPPDRHAYRALWHGRVGDPHGTSLDPGLATITSAEVIDALRELN